MLRRRSSVAERHVLLTTYHALERRQPVDLRDVTPGPFLCVVGTCPAVFETERGTHVIIGKKLASDLTDQLLPGRVGPNETAIEVPSGLLSQLLHNQ